jgi:trans-aconitate methyltransferase
MSANVERTSHSGHHDRAERRERMISSSYPPPMSQDRPLEELIRTDVPHSARIYNYWLGGEDNYEIDRVVGDQVVRAEPDQLTMTREHRAFHGRAVEYLVRECKIRQFLDVGSGLPTADNTHEVAQRAAPECRVVYADNDPIVLAHARTLLTSSPEGATDYLDADMREPRNLLAGAARTLDLSEPVGLIMLGVVHHFAQDGDAKAIIDTLMDALAPGSHLVASAQTNVINPERMNQAAAAYNEAFGRPPIHLYTPERLTALFSGLEPVEPGVVTTTHWRPAPDAEETPVKDSFVGVARKP